MANLRPDSKKRLTSGSAVPRHTYETRGHPGGGDATHPCFDSQLHRNLRGPQLCRSCCKSSGPVRRVEPIGLHPLDAQPELGKVLQLLGEHERAVGGLRILVLA